MKLKIILSLSLVFLCLAASTHAVKVDLPGQAEKQSSHIVTGTITAIYTRVAREGQYEVTHAVAAVRIESLQKGEGFKTGDLIFVRYITAIRLIGATGPHIGAGPHENLPGEGQRKKVCFNQGKDGGLDVYYVSGFQPAEEGK
jgi:hypothetical protein